MDWKEKLSLYLFCAISILAIVIKYSWKTIHKAVPRIAPNKHWPSIFIGSILSISLVFVFCSGYIYIYSPTIKSEKGFWKLESITEDLEMRINSTKQGMVSIEFRSLHDFEQQLPSWQYLIFGLKEEVIYKEIRDAFSFDSKKFEKLKNWVSKKSTKCFRDKASVLMHITNILSTNEQRIYRSLDGIIYGSVRKIKNLHNIEKLDFEVYKASTKKFLNNIIRSFKNAQRDFEKKLETTTETANYRFMIVYSIPSAILLYALFMESLNILFLSHTQTERELTRSLSYLFYACLIQTLALSIYELYLLETTIRKPEGPFHFHNFKIPTYNGSSTIWATEAFEQCSSSGKQIFSSSIHETFMKFDSKFLEKVPDQYVAGVCAFFEDDKYLKPTYLSYMSSVESLSVVEEDWQHYCLDDEYREIYSLINKTMDNLPLFSSLDLGKHSTRVKQISRKVIINAMDRLNRYLRSPISEFNAALQYSNFDCYQFFEAFNADYNRTYFPVNHEQMENLKLAIIACSMICGLSHLLNYRRTDCSQFWDDARVKWANDHIFLWDEETKNRDWKSTNNRNPDGTTYKAFKSNKDKNRYSDVRCIDQTRVILKNHPTDYIHANLVRIPDSEGKYIATQGPLPNTFSDFWKMIVQEKVKVIVQLCAFIENELRICHAYFPCSVGEQRHYGELRVVCTKIEEAPKEPGVWLTFMRTLEIADFKDGKAKPLVVKHIFLHNWFDECFPLEKRRMLFLHYWANEMNDGISPIVVLCDTGNGRSGALICFAYAKSLLKQKRLFNLTEVINQVAQQRWGICDSFWEYLFITVSLAQSLVEENILHYEDVQMSFLKYQRFWNDRMAMMDKKRGDRMIQCHHWVKQIDSDYYEEIVQKEKAKKRIQYEKCFKKKRTRKTRK